MRYQRRTFDFPWFGVLTAVAMPVGFVLAIDGHWSEVGVLVGTLVTYGILVGMLTVLIDDRALELRLGIGLIRRRIPLDTIVSVDAGRHGWWWLGPGAHWTPSGWLWHAAGSRAIKLTLADGRRLRVGTDEPDHLVVAIRTAASEAAGRAAHR
ncbi:MAG: hypothetical protein AAGA48_37775 [Myxococcota bacterium]